MNEWINKQLGGNTMEPDEPTVDVLGRAADVFWAPLLDRAKELCVLYGIDPTVVDAPMHIRENERIMLAPDAIILENNIGIEPGTIIKAGEKLVFQGGRCIGSEPVTMKMGGVGGDVPLYPSTPANWSAKEDRVSWILRNCTDGEKALLYRTLREGCDYRKKSEMDINAMIDKEKKA